MPTLIPSFPIELMNNSSKTQYFRITSPHGFDLGYEIKSLNQANIDNTSFEKLRFGLFLALLAVLVYNLAAAFISREVVQWLYVAVLFPMVMVQGIEIRSLDIPSSYLLPFATLVMVCSMVFLASLFGQFRFKSVRWGIVAFGALYCVLLSTSGLDESAQFTVELVQPFGLAMMSAQVIVAVVAKRPFSRLILLGWSFLLAGVVFTLLAVNGALPQSYASGYAIGSLIEALIFSITLAYRLRDQDQTTELLEQQRQTNERQKEMFAVIGHELRTPVASMAMVAKDSDTSDASARQHMESISSNLLSVLEDLRVVVAPERALESKLEVGHPANKVERAISPLKPMIEESGFSISLVLPVKGEKHHHLHAQPLRQLVTNLVKNAVVHSGGDTVRVELTLDETDATQTQATLRICDNGKGLTEAEQQHVFEAFGRGDTSNDGSGLGLFIVS